MCFLRCKYSQQFYFSSAALLMQSTTLLPENHVNMSYGRGDEVSIKFMEI